METDLTGKVMIDYNRDRCCLKRTGTRLGEETCSMLF